MDRLERSLNNLSRHEFGEIKKLYTTHSILKFSLECLAILQHYETTPTAINIMLADPNLLMKLKQMKLENTEQPVKEKLRTRMHNNKEFVP
jgi:dynein heavy chain